MSAHFPRGGIEQDLTQFAVLKCCDESTGRDEMCNFLATDADKMIDIVCVVDFNNDWF